MATTRVLWCSVVWCGVMCATVRAARALARVSVACARVILLELVRVTPLELCACYCHNSACSVSIRARLQVHRGVVDGVGRRRTVGCGTFSCPQVQGP